VTPRIVGRVLRFANRSAEYAPAFGIPRALAYARHDVSERQIECEWPGYERPIALRACRADLATFIQVVIDEEYRLPFDRAPRTILDGGANIGLSALWFAKHYPDATIVAVEPEPQNFELLRRNTAHLPNVQIARVALSAEVGSASLQIATLPNSHRVGHDATTTSATIDVETVDIATLMDRFDVDRFDVAKLDVEGSELEIFADAHTWIDRVDAIAIELHDRFAPGCSRAFFGAVSAFPNEFSRGETTFVWRDR
jgi:FkbM family methyltransferase